MGIKFVEEWSKAWDICSVEFMGRGGNQIKKDVPQLVGVIDGMPALVRALDQLDKALSHDASPASEKDFEKKYKLWLKEQQTMIAVASKYGGFIKTCLESLSLKEDEYPSAYRAVKVLAKQLNTLVLGSQDMAKKWSAEFQKASKKHDKLVDTERAKLRSQGLTDAQVSAEMNWLLQQKLLMSFPTSFPAAHAKAEAIVQKIKLKPTKETYDAEMKAARDLTQNMCNVIKLLADNKCPEKLQQEMNGIAVHRAQLDAFGNGAKQKIGADKTKEQILAQLKEFSLLIKAMGPFAEKLRKYLAEKK